MRAMKVAKRFVGVLLLILAASSLAARAQATPDYAKERADRAKGVSQPDSWFSLVGLEPLAEGIITVGSGTLNSIVLPGVPEHLFTLQDADDKVVLLYSGHGVQFQDEYLEEGAKYQPLSDSEEDDAALVFGSKRFWIIFRDGKRYLRIKDSEAPAVKNFHGLDWYPPDAHYRIQAQWLPYPAAHTVQIANTVGQVLPVAVPGYVEFTLNGKKQDLIPIEATDDHLWFVFRDETSKADTNADGRFLITAGPSNGIAKPGSVTLDFNEAGNPPCAYTHFASCPFAPQENRIAVAIPAGEKRYSSSNGK